MSLLASVASLRPLYALLALLLLPSAGFRSKQWKLQSVHEPAARGSSGILPSALPTLRAPKAMPAPIIPTAITLGQHIDESLGPHIHTERGPLGAGQTGYLDDLTGRAGLVNSDMANISLDQLASAVKADLQDKRQRLRSAKIWMGESQNFFIASSSEYLYDRFQGEVLESSEYLTSALSEAETSFMNTMGDVDAALQDFMESDEGWPIKMIMNTLDMTPMSEDPLAELQSQFVFGIRTDIVSMINRLSFFEKMRLMFKVIREAITLVAVQRPWRRRLGAVRILVRRFTVPRDRWGKPDFRILYAGSTREESIMLRDLNEDFKGRGLKLITELAPRLEEVATTDFRQTAPEELRWLADQTPNRRSELRNAWLWMETMGIKTFDDPRIAEAEPEIAVLLEVVTRARLLNNLREVLPKVEFARAGLEERDRLAERRQRRTKKNQRRNDHLFMRVTGGGVKNSNLLRAVAISLANSLQAAMPAQRYTADDEVPTF